MALARMLAPEAFGLVSMAMTLTLLFTVLAEFGFAQATIQRPEISDEQISTLFWLNSAIGLALFIVSLGIAPGLAWIYQAPPVRDITMVLAFGFVIAGIQAQPKAVLARHLQFRALAIVELVGVVLSVIVAVALAWAGAGLWALVAQQLVLLVFETGGAWVLSGLRPGWPRWAPDMPPLIRFGTDLTLHNLIVYFSTNADKILLSLVHGAASVGIYERCFALVVNLPVRLLIMPLSRVMIPALSRLQDNARGYAQLYISTVQAIALVTAPAIVLLAVLAGPMVRILFGDGWLEAIPVFAWLALATVGQPVGYAASWLFVSQGRTREQLRFGAEITVVTVIGFAIGVPFGAVGVAASFAITQALLLPYALYRATRSGPVTFAALVGALLPALFGCAVCAVSGHIAATRVWVDLSPLAVVPLTVMSAIVSTFAVYIALPVSRKALIRFLELPRLLRAPATASSSEAL